ncbi:MAG: response regulator, partial [Bacteroidota bacterium]
MGDHDSALRLFKQYHDLDRQLLSEAVNLKTKALHLRHDLEELKKQKEIAELSDKLKEQFLANVSHEIRTPMNGVLGMTHLLDKTRLDQEQKEYIAAIRDSANNLMVIINDILDFSKINAGKVEFEKSEFRIRDLIRGVIQILKVRADEKQLNLKVNIDYRIGEKISGDPIRLNQILMNLIGNAIKFTDRGSVQLDIKLTAAEAGICRLRFSVSDTGQGIPEMKLEKIFESFEQVVDNNKRRTEGTGLGLTIVKQLVELQSGTINVKSKVGEGSEFVFELDFGVVAVDSKPATKPVAPKKQDSFVSSVRILIVEDNKVNQLLVKNMLRQMGCIHIESADGGKSAVRRLEKEEFDLILMDIQMPDMDGYETTHHIRTHLPEPLKKIPIIALTADASEKEKKKAREAGMDDYVVKPYTPEELIDAIRRQSDKFRLDPDLKKMTEKRQQAIIRMDVLEKFTGGDQELNTELMEVFLRQIPEAISRLDIGIRQNDWKEVFGISHKIKSSLSVFGLNDLRRITQLME